LFPAFATAREKARQTTCASNLKQVGMALQMYVQDYDETYPEVYWNGSAWTPGLNGVIIATYPYTKTYAVWTCPSEPTNKGYQWWNGTTYTDQYIFNEYYLARSDKALPYPPVMLSSVTSPSTIIEIGELNVATGNCVLDGYGETFQTGSLRVGYPHSGGANYVYGDGHVKWVAQGVTQAQNTAAWSSFGFGSEWGGFVWQ
jgi:prepilin-type processing-associated H-X9-DG protein